MLLLCRCYFCSFSPPIELSALHISCFSHECPNTRKSPFGNLGGYCRRRKGKCMFCRQRSTCAALRMLPNGSTAYPAIPLLTWCCKFLSLGIPCITPMTLYQDEIRSEVSWTMEQTCCHLQIAALSRNVEWHGGQLSRTFTEYQGLTMRMDTVDPLSRLL